MADDTTLFLQDTASLKIVLDTLKKFEKISGLKLNTTKSEVLQIGKPLTTNASLYDLAWDKDRIYALGSWFYKDYDDSVKYTYQTKLDMIQATLNF